MWDWKFVTGLVVLIQVLSSVAIRERLRNCRYAEDKCPNEHISFLLYKNETRDSPSTLNTSMLSPADFTPRLPVKILIHGFFGNANKPPNAEIRHPLLETQEAYVISVDYEKLVELPCYYPWAPYNARIVGKCLARLTDNLIDQLSYNESDIHIIGFSLGAQVAGFASNFVTHRLQRITALDPARLGFTETDPKTRLDTSDAEFIDVIHTDPYLFALLEPVGHADFYVNFPNPIQPGCDFKRNGFFYNCNHFRAPIYYAESITSSRGEENSGAMKKFWARNCGNWSNYLFQNCNNFRDIPNAVMGYHVSKDSNGSYFLTTNAKTPFAKGKIE